MTTAVAPSPTIIPQPPQAPSQAERLTAELLATKGNLALATERLGLSLSDVLKLLNDPENAASISNAIRSQVVLSAYSALDDLTATLPAFIRGLEPSEAFRAFTSLVTALATLTAPTKNTPSLTLNQQNNFFTEEDAEVARGKLLRFVARVGDSDSIEVASSESTTERPSSTDSVA